MVKFLVIDNFKPILSSQLTSAVTSKDFSPCKCVSKAEAMLFSRKFKQLHTFICSLLKNPAYAAQHLGGRINLLTFHNEQKVTT